MGGKRVLVVGGTGYLGQHLSQGFSEIQGTPYDLAFTYHSKLPQALLDAIPHSLAFHVDLRTGQGFEAISQAFGQVCFHPKDKKRKEKKFQICMFAKGSFAK
jgi:nucleoside-diphosphate-sugar epimerase